jgi:hypothetical protein
MGFMGDPIARDVTHLDLLQFVQSLMKPRTLGERTLPARTRDGINSTLRNLRTFGHWCARQTLLPQGRHVGSGGRNSSRGTNTDSPS